MLSYDKVPDVSAETPSGSFALPTRNAVWAGVVGGIGGGVGMGVVLHAGANMMPLVGAIYGAPTALAGWVAHLGHSVLIGLVFAAFASRPVLRPQTTSVGGCVVVGIAYAAAVGLATGGVMLPVSLNAIGAQAFPQPLLPVPGVLGGVLVVISVGVAHLVYGLVLGATFGRLHRPTDAERERTSVAEPS